MIRFISSLVILFSWSSIQAADPGIFAGQWEGKGTYIYDGTMSQCSEFSLTFSATKDTFRFVAGRRVCDNHKENFYPVTMKYKDGKLFFNGQVVGTYEGNVLESTYRMPDGDSFRTWRMLMRREGNHLVYEESRIMDGEKTPLISFAGLVVLQ